MKMTIINQANWALLLNFFRRLNLFESRSIDGEEIRRERLTTRVYLGFLLLFFLGLVIYGVVFSRTITVTISRPDENEFKRILNEHPETVQCSCSRISIQYREFVAFQVSYHEVCDSGFLKQAWIDAIYGANISFILSNDVRTTMSNFWQLVRSFCDLSKSLLVDVYTDFNATLLLSPTVQSIDLLQATIDSSLNFSLTSASSSLKRNLLITRGSTIGNGLFSGLATNYYFHFVHDSIDDDDLFIQLDVNSFQDGCSCSNFNGCPQSMGIFLHNDSSSWTNIPGMVFDCLPLDATLASSLQCFYDTSCLSQIQYKESTELISQPLSLTSRFAHNTSLQILLDELMIEKLSTTVLFSSYYNQCAPISCSYSYTRKYDVLFILTLVFSIFGGVSVVLRLVALLVIKFVYKIRHRPVERKLFSNW